MSTQTATVLWVIFVVVVVVAQLVRFFFFRPKPAAYLLIAAQSELARLRDGSQSYWRPIQIDEALNAGWSLSDIGTIGEELVEFRCGKSKRIYVQKELVAYQSGEDVDIADLIAFMREEKIQPEDVGASKQELEAYLHDEIKKSLLELFGSLRIAAAADLVQYVYLDPDKACAVLSGGIRFGNVSWEELGTTQEELDSLCKKAWLNQAKLWWKRCRESVEGGSFYSVLNFSVMFGKLRRAGAGVVDLGISIADLGVLARKNYLLLAKDTLETLRQRIWFLPIDGHYTHMGKDVVLPGDPEHYVRLLRKQLTKAKASLEDVGSSQEEVDSLMFPAYFYSAQFLLFTSRKLARSRPQSESTVREISRNVAAVRTFLERMGKQPEEIGTSEEELQAIASVLAAC